MNRVNSPMDDKMNDDTHAFPDRDPLPLKEEQEIKQQCLQDKTHEKNDEKNGIVVQSVSSNRQQVKQP